MTLFIEKIEQRQGKTNIYNINQIDLNNIFSVRKQISSSFPEKLKIEKLARDNGISVRKLQNLFKQIFGITISQFMLNDRMRKAKEMLDSGTYTVSEVGYFLGYTNLSHFTQAFKKKFQVNPKKYSQEAQMIIHNRDKS
jgi:AraC-like DNA-binding protein